MIKIILTKELFASKSAISYKVALFPTLAYKIVKGFAEPFLSLGIEGDKNRVVVYYCRVTRLSKS